MLKKRKVMLLKECEKQLEESSMVTEHFDFQEIASTSSVQHNVEEAKEVISKMIDKSIQVHTTKAFRSKANQTAIKMINQMTTPLRPDLHSISTSPFKIDHCVNSNSSRDSVSVMRRILRKEEQSDSDISYTSTITHSESSPSTNSLEMESASERDAL